MEKLINDFILHMKNTYPIYGAFIVGSYTTKTMKEHSDIDIFFLSKDTNLSIRGRTFFMNQEFEYFISPKESFIDRLQKDITSASIYANAQIVLDEHQELDKIIHLAKQRVHEYQPLKTTQLKKEVVFQLETIYNDCMDMSVQNNNENLLFFMSSQIESLSKILTLIKQKPPVYNKYGFFELQDIDVTYASLLREYLNTHDVAHKKETFLKLIEYLLSYFTEVDVKEFYSERKISR